MGISRDQVEGRTREAVGKVQESAGRMTGNDTRVAKGAIKKGVGAAQAKVGDLKEDLKDATREHNVAATLIAISSKYQRAKVTSFARGLRSDVR
jgi:uncharacterized protein YjbJ (UPF0337 family)